MDCRDIENFAPLYWSGELDARALLEFEAHVKVCAPCAREIAEQRDYDDLLRAAVTAESFDEEPELRRRIRQQIVVAGTTPFWARYRSTWIAVAATLLIVLSSASFFALRRASAPALFVDAAQDHTDEVVRRHQSVWLYRHDQIADLLQRYDVDARLGDSLAPSGYHLDRARVCLLVHQRYLHLVYTNGSNEVTLFLRKSGDMALPGTVAGVFNGKPVHVGTVGDLAIAGFQASGMTVLLVDGLPPAETVHLTAESAAGV